MKLKYFYGREKFWFWYKVHFLSYLKNFNVLPKSMRKNTWGDHETLSRTWGMQRRPQDSTWFFEWLSIVQFILNYLGVECKLSKTGQCKWFQIIARQMNLVQYRILIPASQILIWTSLNSLLVLLLIKVRETLWHGSFIFVEESCFYFLQNHNPQGLWMEFDSCVWSLRLLWNHCSSYKKTIWLPSEW